VIIFNLKFTATDLLQVIVRIHFYEDRDIGLSWIKYILPSKALKLAEVTWWGWKR